jgi:hypothetical protein
VTRLRRQERTTASAGQARKEVRALAWPFAATVAVVAGLSVFGGDFAQMAIPAYYFGIVTIGALSIGHEYTYGTLPMLLSQPVSRARILRAKLSVLVPMLLLVLVLGAATLPLARQDSDIVLVWMPAVAALCLAPWLTMLCRNVIAGAVFSAGLPGGVWGLCELIAFTVHDDTRDAESLRFALYGVAAVTVCATGAIAGLRTFFALEAIDGRHAPLQWPRWLSRQRLAARAERIPSSAVWMLIKKELNLQRMTLVVAGLYVCLFAVIWMVSDSASSDARDVFTIVSVFYAAMLAVLAGALSSAEERHLGTHDWQLMLPFPSSRQWIIKIAIALTLALLLAVGLPAIFSREFVASAGPIFLVWTLFITSCAIYVSSRSTSGIQALLMSFVVLAVAVLLVRTFVGPNTARLGGGAGVALIGMTLAVVALRLGLSHYRTAHWITAR